MPQNYKITITDTQKKMQDILISSGMFKNRTHLTNACIRKVSLKYTGENNPLLPIESSKE